MIIQEISDGLGMRCGCNGLVDVISWCFKPTSLGSVLILYAKPDLDTSSRHVILECLEIHGMRRASRDKEAC